MILTVLLILALLLCLALAAALFVLARDGKESAVLLRTEVGQLRLASGRVQQAASVLTSAPPGSRASRCDCESVELGRD